MDKVRVWLIGGSNEVNPDDLARAIRREMAAEIEIIRDDLRKGIDVDDALRWSHDRLTAPAPREPAQERQSGGADPLREPDYMAKVRQDLLSEYKRGFIAGLIWGRDNTSGISITRRDEFNREIARREGA